MVQFQRNSNSFSNDRQHFPLRSSAESVANDYTTTKCTPHSGQCYNDPEKNHSVFGGTDKISVVSRGSNILLFCAIGALSFFQYNNNHALKASADEISRIMEDFGILQGIVEDTKDELDTAHLSFHHLTEETLNSDLSGHDDYYSDYEYLYRDIYISDEDRKDIAADIIEKHGKQNESIRNLKKAIQDLHRAELEERFGQGPYHVEFKIIVKGIKMFFTLETAPNDLMPHSVYTFMDMVEKKVWDNSVFIHKWNHIVQAAPITPDGETKRDLSAYQLSFPEYSDAYKHDQYTVGFSGRPGGPEFYINLIDNYASHGPGGQEHSTVLNDADPCFAKIVIGKDAFARLRQASLDSVAADSAFFTTIESVQRVRVRSYLLEE